MACKPLNTLIIAKRLLNSADRLNFIDQLELCSANQAMLHHTPQHEAALETFFAKK